MTGAEAIARPRAASRSESSRRGSRAMRVTVTATILSAGVIVVALVSATVGQFATSPSDVLATLGHVLTGGDASDTRAGTVLWQIRFPRAALALLAGASLAVAGAVMQGVFANPLAEPSIIGVSSGASVGATAVIVMGAAAVLPAVLPLAAFAGAVLVTLAVWAMARTGGRAAVLTLVLTGIAINAIATAVTSFLIFLGDSTSREQVIFWQLGSLASADWRSTGVVALVFAVGFAGCLAIQRSLDVLSLGDAAAVAAGVHVERLRVGAILLSCLLTGVAVAFGGIIAFVGLIVPHAIRLACGPSHRFLIPLSALGGAVLLALADIAARTLVPFADLPIGIFTAVVGGPLFLLLLRRTLRGAGQVRS